MACSWKPNWREAKQHFTDWWNHDGLVICFWGNLLKNKCHCNKTLDPGPPPSVEASYTDIKWRVESNHFHLASTMYPGDTLPISQYNIGPGSLALFLGSEPKLTEKTVWYLPTMDTISAPEQLPPLQFDPENKWWQLTEKMLIEGAKRAKGKYIVGCPDLIENIDILASLREPQRLLLDMIERPEWINEKVSEINRVWFEAYSRIYDIIKMDDESSTWSAFHIWGPGKTAKVQCDASAMFSPDMFAQFVVPGLKEQCEWLDYSLFHLDGPMCIPHLDHLLSIEALDAVQWTPGPQVPQGGNSRWYPMYRRILDAGKSVMALGVTKEEVIPLLDAIGGKGVYIGTWVTDIKEAEDIVKKVESYR